MKHLALFLVLMAVTAASVAAIDIPPAISLVANPGTTVQSTVAITAIASDALDNAGIVTLHIYADGVLNSTQNCLGATTCTLTTTFTYLSAGTHSYSAVAVDNGGNSVTSSTLTVTFLGPETPPEWTDLPSSFVMLEDAGVVVFTNLSAHAVDGETASSQLTYAIQTQSNTSVVNCAVATNTSLVCTTQANASGTSTLNLTVSDGTLSDSQLVNVTVYPVNDPVVVATPIANLTFLENGNATFAISPGFFDVDNASLLYSFAPSPLIDTVTFSTVGGITSATVFGALYKNGNASLTLFASDGPTVANQTINIQILPVDFPPILLSPIPNQTWAEDTTKTFNISTFWNETDGQPITYSVTGNTLITIDINNATGIITLTPAANFSGSEIVTFTASDGNLTQASNPVTLTVTPVNDAPAFNASIPLQDIILFEDTLNQTLNLAQSFFDIDSPDINWTAVTLGPLLVSIDQTTGIVNITSAPNASGTGNITFTATDGQLTSGPSNLVTVTVLPVNDAPAQLLTVPNITFAEDSTASLNLASFFGDVDNATLLYSVTSNNANILASMNASTLLLSAVPDFFGNGTLDISVSDGEFTVNANVVVVVVSAVNDGPVALPITNITLPEDTNMTVNLAPFFSDVDNATLLYTASFNASKVNVIMNGSNATIVGNPNFFGNTTITFTASDGALSASAPMTAFFTGVNDAPVVVAGIPNQTWAEDTNKTLSLAAFFNDVDGDTLTYTASPTTNIAVLINSTGGVTLAPAQDFNGVETVTFTASDGTLSVSSNFVVLNVTPVNDAPALAVPIANVTFNEDSNTTFNILTAFTDIDSPDLNWTVIGNPALNVFINNATGDVNISSAPNVFGVVTIAFVASDGSATTMSNLVNVTIVNTPDAPAFSPALVNKNGKVGSAFNYDVNAIDIDGDAVTFNDDNAAFDINNATGVINFVPSATGVLVANVSVCDAIFCTSGNFTITVTTGGSAGGGGGGGGGSSSSDGGGIAPGYNITTPIAFPFPEPDNSGGSSGNETYPITTPVAEPVPAPNATTPTGAVTVTVAKPSASVGMAIISGILVFGLAGYSVVRKLML